MRSGAKRRTMGLASRGRVASRGAPRPQSSRGVKQNSWCIFSIPCALGRSRRHSGSTSRTVRTVYSLQKSTNRFVILDFKRKDHKQFSFGVRRGHPINPQPANVLIGHASTQQALAKSRGQICWIDLSNVQILKVLKTLRRESGSINRPWLSRDEPAKPG